MWMIKTSGNFSIRWQIYDTTRAHRTWLGPRFFVKLAFLTPGTGNYFCGVCMRDNSLARQLIAHGHEVTMLPTYLPHFLDEDAAVPDQPIFFGGINVYLQHKFSFFRYTPKWIDKAFDNKWLLKKAASRSGMTSSKDLGEITLSTFRGEDGPLAKEVNKVLDWFKTHGVPDVLFLSTIMLAGIGKVLKRELGIPVFGFLQGEDSFLDSLLPNYRVEAWKLLSSDVGQLDGCIAPSKYFGDLMAERLSLKPDKARIFPMESPRQELYLPIVLQTRQRLASLHASAP